MCDILGKKIGIIGGGQLGKMMILEAKKLGLTVNILDPAEDCPAHSIADTHIVAGFEDEGAIRALAETSDVITYELEHIAVEPLKALAAQGHVIYPKPETLEIIQDKYAQKQTLRQNGLPVPAFVPVDTAADMERAGELLGFPFLLKARRGGYDGRGNALVNNPEDIAGGFRALGGGALPLMAEEFVAFTKEVSVLSCRGADGGLVVYPVAENTHVDNILIETRVPADVSEDVFKRAKAVAARTLEVFQGVGMFCVEMFVTEGGLVLINEIAPRPHNSGHYTIEACPVSQFMQHVRAITGLPLGGCRLIAPAVMRNILAEKGYKGRAVVCVAKEALTMKDMESEWLALHVYGKKNAVPGRKMGHFTVCAPTLSRAAARAREAAALIKIRGTEREM